MNIILDKVLYTICNYYISMQKKTLIFQLLKPLGSSSIRQFFKFVTFLDTIFLVLSMSPL